MELKNERFVIHYALERLFGEIGDYMATKHEQILQYIESLPVGDKISVDKLQKKFSQ